MDIQRQVSLAERNTLGLDQKAAYLVEVNSVGQVNDAIEYARDHGLALQVLGAGSNVVLCSDLSSLVIHPRFRGIERADDLLRIGAGEVWHDVVLASLELGCHGIENLALIPGLAGAAPIQNIGAYGQEIANVLDHLEAINLVTGTVERFTARDCEFGYRDSVFKHAARGRFLITHIALQLTEAFNPILNYVDLQEAFARGTPTARELVDTVIRIRQRKLPDPAAIGNVGSFFKNPVMTADEALQVQGRDADAPLRNMPDGQVKIPAAWLIERCGLKGHSHGGAAVSDQHALVIINRGRASASDVLALKDKIQSTVLDRFGIRLQVEPELLGG